MSSPTDQFEPREELTDQMGKHIPPFRTEVETVATVATVRVSGEFDAAAAPHFDAQTAEVHTMKVTVVEVDISDVRILDSAGIGAIMRLRQAVADEGLEFGIVAPQPFQRRLFKITGLEHLLTPGSGGVPSPN